jgi:dephospho-CoA kinase
VVPRPVAVALTGGIGAGKSEALRAFARHGAAVRSSDEIVHRLLETDAEVRSALRERWGDGVFADGAVDRAAVAAIVFADRDELDWLEALLHPRVIDEYERWRAGLEGTDVAVVEVPLLYETGGEKRFDKVVVVTAPAHLRARRRRMRDARADRLIPDDEKVARADFAYVNDGSLADLDAFVARVLERLRA